MDLIKSWLNGKQNFIAGRILYSIYGSDESLKALFAKGETADSRSKLVAALRDIIQAPAVAEKTEAEESLEKMPAGNDPVEESIHQDWKAHYTNMNMLRGELDAYGESNSPEALVRCNELCAEILAEERYVNYCWAKLRHYKKFGQLSEVKEETIEIPVDPAQLGTLIKNTERNIRRNKQRARENEGSPLYPALVLKYESLLKKLLNDKPAN